jgi:hypothetical protein
MIVNAYLPFQFLARSDLDDLIEMARTAPSKPSLMTPKTARRQLHEMVKEDQQKILSTLPLNTKLSIALDCWTSPFQQAFMAITGYFLDKDWNYREILLGFEPLHGTHSGLNLSTTLLEVFQQYNITDRVLAITTDNASNNNTLVECLQESLQSLELPSQTMIVRVPCLAHVIQLSLKELLSFIKANPKNNTTIQEWTDTQAQFLHTAKQQRGIDYTLAKVKPSLLLLGL